MAQAQRTYLEFERSFAELESKIEELEALAKTKDEANLDLSDNIKGLKRKASEELQTLYSHLNAWQKTQVARHPERPHFSDYCKALIEDFTPLSGDRRFGEDSAIIGGIGRFRGRSVIAMGHEKGKDTASRLKHKFGMARPEGYRKAMRLMDLAERFNMPVLAFIDTAGAYPGKGAEERGQAEAIARSIERCLTLRVPLISIIIGEGGSGGAVALGASNRVMMLEHAIYSVISPEGCASILWRDSKRASDAAEAMKITADSLKKLGIVDTMIAEPLGGGHRQPDAAISATGLAIETALADLEKHSEDELQNLRREKFLAIGREGLH